MKRRFWISLVLTIPAVDLGDGGNDSRRTTAHLGVPTDLDWVELILGDAPSCCGAGWPFFVRGWHSIVIRGLNMFTLIGLGMRLAYVYSLVAALVPGVFPGVLPRPRGQCGGLFRGCGRHRHVGAVGPGAGIAARSRTGAAIKALLGLAPKTARLVRDDGREDGCST